MTHYVAIDIGGTNIKYGLIDQEGQSLMRYTATPEVRIPPRPASAPAAAWR